MTAENRPTGTCPTCGREGLRLTKSGAVWNHRNPTRDVTSGSYGLNCRGGIPVPLCPDCWCDNCNATRTHHGPDGCTCENCVLSPEYACTEFLPPERIALLHDALALLLSAHLNTRAWNRCRATAHAAHHALLDYDQARSSQ